MSCKCTGTTTNKWGLEVSFPGKLGEPIVKQFARLRSGAQLGDSGGTTITEAGARDPAWHNTQITLTIAGGPQELQAAQA
jgi:hypothetical protein